MNWMNWSMDRLLGSKVRRETEAYLNELVHSRARASRQNTTQLIARMGSEAGPKVDLGETEWGDRVVVPLHELVHGCSSISGGMGAGKSMVGSLIVGSLVEQLSKRSNPGFAVLDAKYELHLRTQYQLMMRYEALARRDPERAKELRRRILIYDFGSRNPLSSYNILARWPGVDPDFYASTRAEMLLDLLPGSDKLSLGGSALLQRCILLLSEFNLPITYLTRFLSDQGFRRNVLAKSKNEEAVADFARQFDAVPGSTVDALLRRIDALTVSESVRLALSGDTAPDFRRAMDEGKIVLINCFGKNISRSVRRLLQALVLSDIRQAVFERRNKDLDYLWFCDEAQNFFLTERLRDNMMELLTMSRSFGAFFCLLTQNISTAVQDARLLKILHTITRWSLSMRSDPADCAFLKPALPVTGRRVRPQLDPFHPKEYYALAEERAILLDEIAHLPDRVGYLWLRTRSQEAVRVKTRQLDMPQGEELERSVQRISQDPTIGMRLSRKEYEQRIAKRDREWLSEPQSNTGESLEQQYRKRRGKDGQ